CLETNEMLASYSIASGKSIDALLQLGKLIKENPAKENYYLLRAKLYMETQKWEVAIIDLNKAIELNPSLGDAYLNRGICFVNVNKSTEACADWQKAIKLGIFKAQELSYKHCK
ncbi:MAG TPA: tetratricopeptide repeat protein, partial [Tenuifilaceae bacterium]|nr:tetratricopeptide repeat protein [Tenuifilaceae bacterium]